MQDGVCGARLCCWLNGVCPCPQPCWGPHAGPWDNPAVHQFPGQPTHGAGHQQGWTQGSSSPPSSPTAASPIRAFQSTLLSSWKCPVAQGPPQPCHPLARSPTALPPPCRISPIPGELHVTLLPPCPVSEHPGALHRTPRVPPRSLVGEPPLRWVMLPRPPGPARS